MAALVKVASLNNLRYKSGLCQKYCFEEGNCGTHSHAFVSRVRKLADIRSMVSLRAQGVKTSERGKMELHALSHSGRPVTATSPDMSNSTDAVCRVDRRRITSQLSVNKGSAREINKTNIMWGP